SISADVPAVAIPAMPVVPAVPAPVVVPAPVATPPPVVPAPAPSGQPMASVIWRDGANVRTGPGSNTIIVKLAFNTALVILDVQPEPNSAYRWVKITLPTGGEGWMREDTLRYNASAASLGLTKADLYPPPMASCWWVRGFVGPLPEHTGWDLGAKTGEPITCGPLGGLVIKSLACAKCTPERPSVKEYGIQVGDASIFTDASWNFGYGHYIIVRYLNEHLPASTQQALTKRGLGGMHLYCMYAHLNSRAVEAGQPLAPNTVIAGCGDTGNSEATHLHLEMRASANANDSNFAGMKKNLLDPGLLFSR
ncbi:MAG TPA: peptidoglycan DD-metalloendopeptidase family protein, partial [Phototrophicaceae bacterium]|nr:peptidoglycan DD-metalloendopeptidase family protein [Phototrophicaceae bacterium]